MITRGLTISSNEPSEQMLEEGEIKIMLIVVNVITELIKTVHDTKNCFLLSGVSYVCMEYSQRKQQQEGVDIH